MVMHVPCTEQKTEAELLEMVNFYEKVASMMDSGEMRHIHSKEELLCRSQGVKGGR